MRRRILTLAALTAGLLGAAGLSSARADEPKPDAAARQKFVALLTSVKPTAKVNGTSRAKLGSLKAFIGVAATTPTRGIRGR